MIDRGGLDLTYSIHKYLFPHIESSAEPSKLMVQLMDEGKLGLKRERLPALESRAGQSIQ